MRVKSPLKWHGGKFYLADRIVSLMPPHTHFCEPFAGSLSVLLAKDPEGVSEVVNDLNAELSNFWRVLQHPNLFGHFVRQCEATPFSEFEFRAADDEGSKLPWDRAHAFFVRCRQSLAGRMKSFTGVTKTRTRRGMNNEVSAWLTAVEGLPAVHARLRRVLILNRPALDVIRGQDSPQTLFYVDAPYVKATRTAPDVYAHEMTDDQHRELVETLLKIEGRAMVSMYHHQIYDILSTKYGWHMVEFNIANHAAGGKSKNREVECLWMNFKP